MTDITIPPEALEAAEEIIADNFLALHLTKDEYTAVIRAACLAMLKAWETDTHRMIVGTALDEVGGTYPAIILPLPPEKETSDE